MPKSTKPSNGKRHATQQSLNGAVKGELLARQFMHLEQRPKQLRRRVGWNDRPLRQHQNVRQIGQAQMPDKSRAQMSVQPRGGGEENQGLPLRPTFSSATFKAALET